jgi:rabenosyn-5
VRDVGRIERTKLERRLEKLIDLHFPVNSEKAAQPPPANRRASSFFDFNISDLKNVDAGGLWKGMLQSPALQGGAKSDIRGTVQRFH